MYTLLLIVVTLVISLIITPIIIKVSFKFNLVDRPNHKPIRNESSMTVPPMTDIGFVCTFL